MKKRLSQKILEWYSPGGRRRRRRRRRRVKPRNSWMPEVATGMREKGINNMEWIDENNGKIK